MTVDRAYLRPIGLMLRVPEEMRASSRAHVIASSTDASFASCELIRRHTDHRIERRLISVAEARSLAGAPSEEGWRLAAQLAHLEALRAPLAGLPLDHPRLMGIVNVTPDSFSDGGRFLDAKAAIAHALALEAEGADILDIGAESTRPGAEPLSLEEELRRLMPVLEGLAGRTRALLSVDTRKAEVMHRAARLGVHLINDVSALSWDGDSLAVVAETGLPVVLMHAQGDPRTMQANPTYDDVLLDVYDWLAGRIEACERAGIAKDRLILDPGIGFGKTVAHNLELMAGLSLLHTLGCPVLLGASRKFFIGALTGVKVAAERVPGSVAAALAGVAQGAQILRVHDVAATRQALTVWEAATAGRVSP